MSLFTIDDTKCKRDGICAAECPRGIILFEKWSVPVPVDDAKELCISCGHCVSVCPYSALTLSGMKATDCPPVREELRPDAAQLEQILRSRRSIRCYQDRQPDRETLDKLIRISSYAPTGTNSQQLGWIVINSKDRVRELAGKVIDWIRYMESNQNEAAERYRMKSLVEAWDAGRDMICRSAPALVVVHAPKDYGIAQVDASIALTYFDLSAPSVGLGTCWAGFFMFGAAYWPPLQRALSIPEGRSVYGAMMVGYPKYKFQKLPLRKDPMIDWCE